MRFETGSQVREDPIAQRNRSRSTPTFTRLLETYWQRVALTWKPSTRLAQDKYRRLYLDHAFDGRGIDDEEVVRWFAAITRRGSPGAANRTLCILCAVFNKAIEWGERPAGTNATRGVRRNRKRIVERHLSDAEFARVGTVLEEMSATAPLNVVAVRLLTGCRLNEIAGLQLSEVRGRRLLLTDSKTGLRTVWLGDEAREVLDGIPRRAGVAGVFDDPSRGRPIRVSSFWPEVRVQAGLDHCRLHDLRQSFAGHAAAKYEALPMIGKLLGYASFQSTARDAHLDDSLPVKAAEQVGDAILCMLPGA